MEKDKVFSRVNKKEKKKSLLINRIYSAKQFVKVGFYCPKNKETTNKAIDFWRSLSERVFQTGHKRQPRYTKQDNHFIYSDEG
jgi:hypothetical protein